MFISTEAGVDSVCQSIPADAGIVTGSCCTIQQAPGTSPATVGGTAMASCWFPAIQSDD